MITSALILSVAFKTPEIGVFYKNQQIDHKHIIYQTANAFQASVSLTHAYWISQRQQSKNNHNVIRSLDVNEQGWPIGIQTGVYDCIAVWQSSFKQPPAISLYPLEDHKSPVPLGSQWASWHDKEKSRCTYKHFFNSHENPYLLHYDYLTGTISAQTPQ